MTTNEPEIAQLANKAADVIDKHGWTRGEFGDELSGFCIMGAFRHSADIQTDEGIIVYSRASAEFQTWLISMTGRTIANWNDHICQDGAEAILHLRKFADEVDPQAVPE